MGNRFTIISMQGNRNLLDYYIKHKLRQIGHVVKCLTTADTPVSSIYWLAGTDRRTMSKISHKVFYINTNKWRDIAQAEICRVREVYEAAILRDKYVLPGRTRQRRGLEQRRKIHVD